jgi:CBS domain-containing protein
MLLRLPTDSLDYCMELMSAKRIRHLPVVENNVVLGVDRGCNEVHHRNTKRNNSAFGFLYQWDKSIIIYGIINLNSCKWYGYFFLQKRQLFFFKNRE